MNKFIQTLLFLVITVSLSLAVPANGSNCTYTVDTDTVFPPILMKGKSSTCSYTIQNTCTDFSTINFQFIKLVNVSPPGSFSLAKGVSKTISVKYTMPATVDTDTMVTFSFTIKPDCGDETQISFTIKAGSDCSFQITKNDIPSTIKLLEKGCSYSYSYILKNTSIDKTTYTVTKDRKIDSVSNLPTTLDPGAAQEIVVKFTMPSSAETSSKTNFYFKINTSCDTNQTVFFSLMATDPTFTMKQNTTSLTSLVKGLSYTYVYTIKNLSSNTRYFTTSLLSNIVSIIPDTFSIDAKESITIQITFFMPSSTKAESKVLFSFAVTPESLSADTGCQKIITFTIKAIDICCSYSVVKNSSPPTIKNLTMGDSYTYEYTIKNTCSSNKDKIMFTMKNASHITSLTPSSFELDSGESKTVLVSFTMPADVTPNASVTFSFQVIAGCKNESKTVTFHIKATQPT